ncbi:MAG TPA: sensor histidine kinase, partial [Stellaceae bacterium]|nr:sensor histidine kinase [Stellaceae bacterium]
MNTSGLLRVAEPRTSFDRISLRRLVLIRSVAVTGQAITLLLVHFLLGFKLPLLPALVVVGCSVLLNIGALLYHRVGTRLGETAAALYLAY